jgi:hypothetical protein
VWLLAIPLFLTSLCSIYICEGHPSIAITITSRSKACGLRGLRSLARSQASESHSGHGYLVFVCMCAFFCLCTDSGLAASWSPAQGVLPNVSDLVNRSETESFVEVGQGPNEGCSAEGEKIQRSTFIMDCIAQRLLLLLLLLRLLLLIPWQCSNGSTLNRSDMLSDQGRAGGECDIRCYRLFLLLFSLNSKSWAREQMSSM